MAGASGKKLDDTYKLAWKRGLKTTYYLRTLGATSAEKSTGRGGELNAVSAESIGVGLGCPHLLCRNPKFSGRFAPCGRAIPASKSAKPANNRLRRMNHD